MKSVYITSVEGRTGKSTVALGVVDLLLRQGRRVGVFRPIARTATGADYVLDLLLRVDGVVTARENAIGVTYDDVHADADGALSVIIDRYKAVEASSDVVVIVGSDYTDVGTPTELGYNARIAANLGAPVLLVLGGRAASGADERLGQSDARTAADLHQLAEVAGSSLRAEHADLLATIVNRADPDAVGEIAGAVASGLDAADDSPVWTIPEDPLLVAPAVRSIMASVDGELLRGDPELLDREALGVVVAAMSMENVLPRLIEGSVVVVPGDRTEVLLAVLMANASGTFPSIAAIVLNGGFELSEPIQRLLQGIRTNLPIIGTSYGSYETTVRITHTRGRLAADSEVKRERALALFEKSVDEDALLRLLDVSRVPIVTPLAFGYELLERARSSRKHIVLPEGGDDRILRAAGIVLARGIADLTILGESFEVRSRAIELGVDIRDAQVLSPFDDVLRRKFAAEYAKLRAHKGITLDQAADTVTDVSYFGTLMVHLGLADGMVSGAAHTTAHTIRPAFEIIKTKPGVDVVSSVFLMALADRVLVYGDCAVIPDPTADQLADIAVSSAATAAQFGIEPRVAMLSYSTGESGTGADVEKVREATSLVHERAPELLVEGPIQYDAAADAAVAAAKLPGSSVAGRATVFIFPDLNTGNNTYKAVQRSAGAVAIGPVLQGLRKPINDLSRGALVDDIVNTIAITAIQAQA
ncbi:phosphate acetyltransferase [Humibacter ginsenosidimutans]|uniref:Phosphate acetyltransferase n=1 Tax=Humibacter ginsenosidimutans TaxID=2599293 RepID=A0A5B8M9I8_9MICO|nr:phosphate acetyltransferase [Humibacter ginsenosidimutans]QDZ16272.1 phosphate acetyltransferase [Humibacter ginsenosidimutans]